MIGFNRKNNSLYVDEVLLSELASDYGTPSYIYSAKLIKENFERYSKSLRSKDLTCYAVKANPNIEILKLLNEIGSGFDVVSANEIKRTLLAGADSSKIVFSGVGKTIEEISFAIDSDILFINIESYSELIKVNDLAIEKKKKVLCSFRLNPDISAKTHEYISTGLKTSKFGISRSEIIRIAKTINNLKGISIRGLSCHIGSQITDPSLNLEVLKKVKACAVELEELGINITHLNLGGGLGIRYKDEIELSIEGTVNSLIKEIGDDYHLIVEPGRSISGNAGVLISKVELIKETENTSFALLNAGMNDFLRPALYNAWHNITEIEKISTEPKEYIVVGPVCESSDVFGEKRNLSIREGSIVAILGTGAYGLTMGSNYNSRTNPPELLVNGSEIQLIRKRESFEDMIRLEGYN